MNAPLQKHPAEELAAENFRVFPIPGARKAPPVRDWQHWATCDAERVRAHWQASPQDNIGIACGGGLLVLDVDGEAGARSLAALEATHGKLPETCKVCTPSGGAHFYFSGPDVANSASRIGEGLDVRGKGGYVVAPGSRTEKGAYTVAHAAEPAPAPQWLLNLCAKPRDKANTGKAVPDAPASLLEGAREWLAKQPPAIEGQGGDAHTFATICGLRDMGVSQPQAVELLAGEWNERCAPPWAQRELIGKVRNAYAYASNEAGSKVALPEDFPIVVRQQAGAAIEKAARPRTKGATAHEFARRLGEGRGYLVKGLLGRNSYAVMFGAPGVGKSFLALDIAYHVAARKPWRDRRVNGGPALYLAFEGTGGMAKRAAALERHYGSLAGVPLVIEPAHWNLIDAGDRKDFAERVAEIIAADFGGQNPALIVIDTLAASFRGEENSAKDMGAFNSAMGALAERTGAGLLVLHHSGKNRAAGARGSSALLGAVDAELEVDGGQLKATKQRDIELGAPIGFELRPVPVGEDADGEPMVSCVVVAGSGAPRAAWKPTGQPGDAWNVLCRLRPNNDPLPESEWKAAFVAEAWRAEPPGEAAVRKAWQRALKALGERVTRTPDGWQRVFE